MCYVDHNEPRKRSVAIHLKDVERPEFYVGSRLINRVQSSSADPSPGWLSEVLSQDNVASQALETAIAGFVRLTQCPDSVRDYPRWPALSRTNTVPERDVGVYDMLVLEPRAFQL